MPSGPAFLALVLTALVSMPTRAEGLRVGVPQVNGYTYLATQVALQNGYFKNNGIDVDVVVFAGGAKLQQAIFANSIDLAVSGGTDFAYIVKGVPEVAVAAVAGPPLALGIIVPYQSSIVAADDLKGKKVGITSAGSLSEWLLRRMAQKKGWGSDALTLVATGSSSSGGMAALATGEIDALMTQSAVGYQLELSKRGRLLFPSSDYVEKFLVYATFATIPIIRDRPETVRRFLKAWFENIADMRAHRAKTVDLLRSLTKFDLEVQSREYDLVMPMFSIDGRFEPDALNVLANSFVEMGMLDTKPDMSKLYTEEYLPRP